MSYTMVAKMALKINLLTEEVIDLKEKNKKLEEALAIEREENARQKAIIEVRDGK